MSEAWVRCTCRVVVEADDEFSVWELFQQHVEQYVELGEVGLHSVDAHGKPLTYPLPESDGVADTLAWVTAITHRQHEEAGGFARCSHITCLAATRALEAANHEVSMSSVLAELPRAPGVYCPDPSAHAPKT